MKRYSRFLWSFGIVFIGLLITVSFYVLTCESYRNNPSLSHWLEMGPLSMGPFLIFAIGLGVSRNSQLRKLLGIMGIVIVALPALFATGLAYREMLNVRISGKPLFISAAEGAGVYLLVFVMYPFSIVILLMALVTNEIDLLSTPRRILRRLLGDEHL